MASFVNLVCQQLWTKFSSVCEAIWPVLVGGLAIATLLLALPAHAQLYSAQPYQTIQYPVYNNNFQQQMIQNQQQLIYQAGQQAQQLQNLNRQLQLQQIQKNNSWSIGQ